MKKFIYISGIVAANLILFGSIFKIMHWPGANILLVLAIFTFCFLFLPLALISSYKSQVIKKFKWLHIVTFIVFFITLVSALFKIVHWPGAGILMLIGIPLPFVLFLPVYLFQIRKEKDYAVTNLLGVMLGLTFVAVFSVLLAMNISRNILNSVAFDFVRVQNAADFNQSKLAEVKDIDGIKQKSDDLCQFIEAMKCELLTLSSNNLCENDRQTMPVDPYNIFNMDKTEASDLVLYRKNETGDLPVLKEKIQEFKNAVISSMKTSDEVKKLTNTLLLSTEENLAPDYTFTWEQLEFPTMHLIAVIDALQRIQSNIRLIEAEMLSGQ
ncbi:MAG: hypothetical protein CVU05_10270 [Bacteroidetes bacterium HGW-Bacteroidetes-21]|jgi:hypothetical protein|nr:MAG: hypothetical protein CVU05_10270 [Bacteroidetes bacterium HGW-Bacteroidetes-21]